MNFEITVEIEPQEEINLDVEDSNEVDVEIEAGGGVGTTDYEKLKNLPSINDIPIIGNVLFGYNELSEAPRPITNMEIQKIIDNMGGL